MSEQTKSGDGTFLRARSTCRLEMSTPVTTYRLARRAVIGIPVPQPRSNTLEPSGTVSNRI